MPISVVALTMGIHGLHERVDVHVRTSRYKVTALVYICDRVCYLQGEPVVGWGGIGSGETCGTQR